MSALTLNSLFSKVLKRVVADCLDVLCCSILEIRAFIFLPWNFKMLKYFCVGVLLRLLHVCQEGDVISQHYHFTIRRRVRATHVNHLIRSLILARRRWRWSDVRWLDGSSLLMCFDRGAGHGAMKTWCPCRLMTQRHHGLMEDVTLSQSRRTASTPWSGAVHRKFTASDDPESDHIFIIIPAKSFFPKCYIHDSSEWKPTCVHVFWARWIN